MAQLWQVGLPRSRVGPTIMFGETPLDAVGIPVFPKATALTNVEITAAVVLGAGILSAYGLYLMASGRSKQAYTLGVAGALVGGVFGAMRVLRESRWHD